MPSLKRIGGSKQADTKTFGAIDFTTIHADCAIGNCQNKRAGNGALDMNVVSDFFGSGQNLAKEFYLARTQRTAATGITLPAKVKADQLPHGIQTQTARHYRIAFKVATEKP